MYTKIIINTWAIKQLQKQRQAYLPEECCAILLGRDVNKTTVRVENVCPIQNLSPAGEFLMDPQQQGNIVMSVKDGGGNKFVKIAAHYHSHPINSLGRPSSTDFLMAQRGWAVGLHLIEGSDGLNAFTWDGKVFTEAEIEINEIANT
jgi:proteasome lid subunit RPN8/RPN11